MNKVEAANARLTKGAQNIIDEWMEKNTVDRFDRERASDLMTDIFDEWMVKDSSGRWEVRHDIRWLVRDIAAELRILMRGCKLHNGVYFVKPWRFRRALRGIRRSIDSMIRNGSFRISAEDVQYLNWDLADWAFEQC